MKKIKVLIVDDSAVVRQVLTKIFSSDPELEVLGALPDAKMALKKILELKPDVLTLDIQMPGMDGLTFLEHLMKSNPMPVVMISVLTEEGSPETFRALELGAIEVIAKPKLDIHNKLEELSIEIIDTVKAAAVAKIKDSKKLFLKPEKKLTADAVISKKSNDDSNFPPSEKIIAIGSSTGGTDALPSIFSNLPDNLPGIVIVQHMPALFTKSFANRLNNESKVRIKEAENGDIVQTGHAFLAPGGKHMVVLRNKTNQYVINIKEGPLVTRHRPSVDVLFRSVSSSAGSKAIGIILTGMGDDGAQGLLEMRQAGAYTIAQDEESCVVFGMPCVAIKVGAANQVLPLTEIPKHLVGILS